MATIAAIITDSFEDSEYTGPAKAFKDWGHRVVTVGFDAGKTVAGKRHGTRVEVEESLDQARPQDFDALLIPGGYSPDKLRADPRAVAFVKAFMDADKPVFSICHGPQLLISAEVLRGRKVAGWKSIAVDIQNAGAEFTDREVVVDGNLVSSRSPADLPAFIRESLKMLS